MKPLRDRNGTDSANPTAPERSKTVQAMREAFAEFDVRPARSTEIDAARQFALELIGGRMASTETIASVHSRTGVGLFLVPEGEGIRGLLAFILLNRAGADAAVCDDFDSLAPRPEYVCASDEEPVAIYSWAIAAADKDAATRLIRGHERLRHVAAAHLPFYCRLATENGRRLGIVRMGFKPLPGSQSGLFWSEPRAESLVEAAA